MVDGVVGIKTGIELSGVGISLVCDGDKRFSNLSVKFGTCLNAISGGRGGICGGWYGAVGCFDRNPQLESARVNVSITLKFRKFCILICFLKFSGLGLDNTPDDEALENLKVLCEKVLQPVREHFGKSVTVNSGFRSPESNAAVGGSKSSDHCKGQAADIEIAGIANADLAQWVMDNLDYTQLILEFYTQGIPDSGWVHVSYDPDNLKNQELTAVKVAGKTQYLNGLHA